MSPHRRAGDRRRPVWPPESRGVSLLILVTLLTIGVALSPAQAADGSGHSAHLGVPAGWVCLLAAGLAGLGFGAAGRCGRRAAVLSLGLLVGLFGLESAIHSVHHLSDPQAAATCVLLSASQHAPGTCAATPDAGAPTWTAQPSATFDAEPIRPLQAFRAHEGRAPPVLPSV